MAQTKFGIIFSNIKLFLKSYNFHAMKIIIEKKLFLLEYQNISQSPKESKGLEILILRTTRALGYRVLAAPHMRNR